MFPRCPKFLQVPTSCNLVKDPQGCCEVMSCPQVITTTDPTCRDPLDNCADYGHEACVGQYEPWAKRNCPHYCGFQACGE